MPRLPTIVHIDADAFFVSCEQAVQPELRGTKCACGGGDRGIISSASYEARACGVYTPMPTARALKVCPDLILIKHTSGLYGKVSQQMFDLCETLTPHVQRNSVDEGYLDLTPCGYRSTEEIVAVMRGLQKRMWEELRIPISIGIATNKLVAQVASKYRKPQGFEVIKPGKEQEFFAPLSIGELPGVGKKSQLMLKERGIIKMGDVLQRNESELQSLFGRDWRNMLARARGEDDSVVHTDHDDAKSYSHQETFTQDISDFEEIERVAKRMVDSLLTKIRADRKTTRTMTLKVRYPDFTQESHGRSLPEATDLESLFYPLIAPLLKASWRKRRPLRLISIRFSGIEEGARQLDMFAAGDEKRRKLAAVMDKLNETNGGQVVTRGHQLPSRMRMKRSRDDRDDFGAPR